MVPTPELYGSFEVCACVCVRVHFLTPVRLFRLSSRTFTVRKNALLARTCRSTSRKYFLCGREKRRCEEEVEADNKEEEAELAYFPWSGVRCSMKETLSSVSWSLS